MDKSYEAQKYEDEIYRRWEESGYFNPDNLSGEPYSIMMPPPNVTGVLHLGHALENALMDTMARYQRMRGRKVLLLPGTDHAAVATQAKVEKILVEKGMKHPREELGRKKLLEEIRNYAENSKATILKQIRTMGTSCDWSRLAYTFDEKRSVAVNEVFVKMYNDGLIYRGHRVINWSVKGQSTCSDDELVHVERAAKFYTFKYSRDFPITIATTRPETKLGDTAVAVNPNDERYRKFIGQTFVVDVGAANPLEIKIIADENVDPTFGTGALGVTPAHSMVDFEMYVKQKAKCEPIGLVQVIGVDGRMTEESGSNYAGLTIVEAREKFVEWLKENGLFEKEEDIIQNVGTSDRFGDVVESLPMTQWFVDVNKIIPEKERSLKQLMIEAVKIGLNGDKTKKINIVPERFEKNYFNWIEILRDWCISRQIWWGHTIPVYYCKQGNSKSEFQISNINIAERQSIEKCEEPIVSVDEIKKCPYCGGEVERDPDTLDTWFSSGLWTFSTLGWPEKTADLEKFHPTNWMQMGCELVFFWMARMILMSTYVLNEIPFKDVYIHGMLRDESGKKFSKSDGNGVDPIEVVNEYGCDALRLSLISGISPGNDARFYEEKIEGSRNFVNKLWNIARYISENIKFHPTGGHPKGDKISNLAYRQAGDKQNLNVKMQMSNDCTLKISEKLSLADEWILKRLNTVVKEVGSNMDKYNFSQATEILRDFTWNELADWYLEIAKIEGGKDAVLECVLNTILKLWHPFIPFVTEQIWSELYDKNDLLMIERYPEVVSELNEVSDVGGDFELIKNVISGIRSLRADYRIEPAKKLNVVLSSGDKKHLLEDNKAIIMGLARVENLLIEKKISKPNNSIGFVAGGVEVYINIAGVVDVEKEKIRISKEIKTVELYLVGLDKKLSNEEFARNAPMEVVEKEQVKLAEATEKLEKLRGQLAGL